MCSFAPSPACPGCARLPFQWVASYGPMQGQPMLTAPLADFLARHVFDGVRPDPRCAEPLAPLKSAEHIQADKCVGDNPPKRPEPKKEKKKQTNSSFAFVVLVAVSCWRLGVLAGRLNTPPQRAGRRHGPQRHFVQPLFRALRSGRRGERAAALLGMGAFIMGACCARAWFQKKNC